MAPTPIDTPADTGGPARGRPAGGRGFRLTASTPVHVAWAHLRDRGEPAAVVFRAGRPVGVVTEAALERARAAGQGDLPVGMVLDHVTVPVDRLAGERETVRRFIRAASDWLMRRPLA
ncbi:MAG TPA: hypothetical protein VIL48_05890 [Acidimicrobiales bacterium]